MRRGGVAAAALAGLLAAGCGASGETGGGSVDGDVLRIYSSQPLRGALAENAQAIVRGEQLALHAAGGRVGKWRIDYRPLDDADPTTGIWEPGMVSANARRAAQDDKTIAYLGEMGTGASAVSIPILNETGILDVSPTDSVTGFTRETGANPGEPDKYYPTRDENFARLVPPDSVQADALLRLAKAERAKRLYVAHDEKLYGQGVARAVARGARAQGLEVVKVQALDLDEADPARAAAEVPSSGADAFLYCGDPLPGVPGLYDAVTSAAPRAKLLGTYTQVNEAFALRLERRTTVLATAPWLALRAYPPAARQVARRYEQRYGEPMPAPALYGYEAMDAVLGAVRRAGDDGNDRGEVIDAMLDTRGRRSVLGEYSIDRNGDTTIRTYGAYRIRDGQVIFLRALAAPAG